MNEATVEQNKPKGTGREIAPLVVEDVTIGPPPATTRNLMLYQELIYISIGMARRLGPRLDHEGVVAKVAADVEARVRLGETRYGERLRAHNGRDAAVDLYQEILDALLYCRQLIEEER